MWQSTNQINSAEVGARARDYNKYKSLRESTEVIERASNFLQKVEWQRSSQSYWLSKVSERPGWFRHWS